MTLITSKEMNNRLIVVSRFLNILGNDPMSKNLEKSVYNYAVKIQDPSWENPSFRNRYRHKAMEIIRLLEDPKCSLKSRLLGGEITTREVGQLAPDQLFPGGPWDAMKQEIHIEEERRRAAAENVPEGLFQCRKCKSKKTRYYQMQTRSADEPMTTFVTCLQCSTRWKC